MLIGTSMIDMYWIDHHKCANHAHIQTHIHSKSITNIHEKHLFKKYKVTLKVSQKYCNEWWLEVWIRKLIYYLNHGHCAIKENNSFKIN